MILDVAGSSPVGRPNRSHAVFGAPLGPAVRDLKPRDDLVLLDLRRDGRADAAAIAGRRAGIDLMEARGPGGGGCRHRAPCPPAGRRAVRSRQQRWRRLRGGAPSAGKALAGAGGPVGRAWRAERRCSLGGSALGAGEAAPLALDLLDGRPLVIDALFGARPRRGPSKALPASSSIGSTREALTTRGRRRAERPAWRQRRDHGPRADGGRGRSRSFAPSPATIRSKDCGAAACSRSPTSASPPSVLHEIAPRLWLNAPALWQSHLQRTDRGDHKYARGHAHHPRRAKSPPARRVLRRSARAGREQGSSPSPRRLRHLRGLSGGRAGQSRHGVRGR